MQFVGIEVQVSLGRQKPASCNVPKPLNHRLVCRIWTESAKVLFNDIDPPIRNPDPVGRKVTDRSPCRLRVEFPAANRSPCSKGVYWSSTRQPSPGDVVAAEAQQTAANLQAVAPGQAVLANAPTTALVQTVPVDVPAATAHLHRVLPRVPVQSVSTPTTHLSGGLG